MIETLNTITDKWFTWQIAMLWQTAVLIAIIWMVDVLIRKWAHPQVRYALWMLVLVKLLIPPTFTSPASITSQIPDAAFRAATVMERLNTESQGDVASEVNGTQASSVGDTQRGQDTHVPLNAPETTDADSMCQTKAQSAGGGIPAGQDTIAAAETTASDPIRAATVMERSDSGASSLSWKVWAMFIWLAGIAVLSAWLIARLSGLRREHIKGGTAFQLPQRFGEQLQSAAEKLNLKRLPQVVLTDKVSCPAVFGVFRPVLLMPAEKFKSMSKQDTEHILLHELAHIKRGDLLVHAVYMTLQIAYWFNPLLWMIRRTLQNLRELCCDATVAKLLKENTVHYRQTLLETARQLLAEPVDPGLGLLGLFENSNWLVTRLKWLEKNTWKNRRWRLATIIILVALMTTCVLPMANRPKTKAPSGSDPIENTSFTAALPNGVRVELVAINHFGAESGWWKPDGSPCDIDIDTEDHSNYPTKYPGYEFIFKMKGVENRGSLRLDVKGCNQQSGLTVKSPEGLLGWRSHIKPRYKDTALKMGILMDDWKTIASHTGYGTTDAKISGKKIIFSPTGGTGNEFSITVSDELSYNLGKRIVALDKDGQIHTGQNIGGLFIDDLHQNTFRFKGIARSSIKEFQFQTRPYQWVAFKDVALRPKEEEGFKVTGVVTDAGTGTPIAAAEVYDDGYDNNKCRTATDEDGNFTLKTASEEHNISARAEDYQPQSKGLYTWPFANNKDFNFKLIQNSSVVALFPYEVTLEQIMEQAQAEARQLNHEYIGTEHLLLALVSNEDAAACIILNDLGLNAEQIRFEIDKLIKAGPTLVTKEHLSLTPRAKEALSCARQESMWREQDSVTSVHVLLGLLRSYESVASGILNVHNIYYETVWQKTKKPQNSELRTENSQFPAEYIGHWKGQAKIIVSWTKQKDLPIDIQIHPDGTVEGKVGDAALVNGKLEKKSWVYTKIFQHENPYRITGDLQGDIIADEGIRRDSVFISLRVEDGKIDGGLGTSGTKIGGKETMILSAMDVSLTKIDKSENVTQNSELKTESSVSVLSPQSSGGNPEDSLMKSPMNFTFKKGMRLTDALQMLSKMYKVNIIPSNKTLRLNSLNPVTNLYDVTFEEALKAICGSEYTYVIKDNFIYVYTNEEYAVLPKELTLEQAQKAIAAFWAQMNIVESFKPLEWGQLILRDDGTQSLRCKYELTFWGKDEKQISDSMFFFDKTGKVDSLINLQGNTYVTIDQAEDRSSQKAVERVLTEDHLKKGQFLNLVSGEFVCFDNLEAMGKIVPHLGWTGDVESYLGWSMPKEEKTGSVMGVGAIGINLVVTRGPLNLQGKPEKNIWQVEDVDLLPSFEGLSARSNSWFIGPPDKWPGSWAFKGNDGTIGVIKIEKVQDRKIFLKYKLFKKESAEEETQDSELKTEGYTATLPNGVTVELVGVCKARDNQKCWAPNGFLLSKAPYYESGAWSGSEAFEFAFKVKNIDEAQSATSWKIEGKYATGSGNTGHPTTETGEAIADIWVIDAKIIEGVQKCDISFGVAADSWQTQAKCVGVQGAVTSKNEHPYTFSPAYSHDNMVCLTVSEVMVELARRLVLIDKNGNTHLSELVRMGSTKGLCQSTFGFKNLKLEDVKEFQFQTQPYKWVTFKNVSLRPGVKTNMEK